jgi:hypothetical protein
METSSRHNSHTSNPTVRLHRAGFSMVRTRRMAILTSNKGEFTPIAETFPKAMTDLLFAVNTANHPTPANHQPNNSPNKAPIPKTSTRRASSHRTPMDSPISSKITAPQIPTPSKRAIAV